VLNQCAVLTSDHKYANAKLESSSIVTNDRLINQNPTEKAIIKFFSQYDDPVPILFSTEYATTNNGIQVRVPFSADKKYSLCVSKSSQNDDGFFTVFIKGSQDVYSLSPYLTRLF
jgi:magnesium-transporting ATPase (P-type)